MRQGESVEVGVRLRRLPHGEGLPLPARATEGASGWDLLCALEQPLVLSPGSRALVPTGLCLQIPPGYEGQVRPRSGLALRYGVTCLNSPGTIDRDYRGEVRVLLVNLGSEPVTIERGMRIAQLVFAPVARSQWIEQKDLEPTARGTGGFGHTGLGTPSTRRDSARA